MVFMKQALVAYFSATGTTARAARLLSQALESPVYEIRPEQPYTQDDLDWTNQQSRSTLEMKDKDCRPPLLHHGAPVQEAQVVFIGYPVWWYREPSIIDSFLAAYDFTGKTIIPFATSGGSGIGQEAPQRIQALCPGAKVLPGRLISSRDTATTLKQWAESLV